jgi:short-subunit dehydrogenase
MTDTFSGKGFIVTGAASGIGLETAKLLQKRGAKLALWDVNGAALEQSELDACKLTVEITQPEQVTRALSDSLSYLGGLDGVVHCAGISRVGPFEQLDIESHRRSVEVNLFGTLLLAHSVLPHLRQSRGSLVMVASVAGFFGTPEFASYSATKAGILAFAQAMRVELHGTGVHVGVVSPHFVDTPMYRSESVKARISHAKTPLIEVRPPDQIAQAIVRGIEKRQFMMYPGWRSRLIFRTTRYLHFIAHWEMLRTFKSSTP